LTTNRFLTSIGAAWSPAENVRHLASSDAEAQRHEMLFFTLIHNRHHYAIVRGKLAAR